MRCVFLQNKNEENFKVDFIAQAHFPLFFSTLQLKLKAENKKRVLIQFEIYNLFSVS